MKNIIFVGLVILFIVAPSASAQPEFQFSLQSWGSYTSYEHTDDSTSTQLGFGIRRARIRGKMMQGKAAAFIQYEAINSTIIDVRLDYILSDNLMFRMGRFVGPGSQAGSRTGHTSIDLIERSIVGRNWAIAVDRKDSRSYGLALLGKLGNFGYELMASNGDNSVNLNPYNNDSSKSKTDTGKLPQFDVMDSCRALHFKDHPCANSVLGTNESIDAMTSEQMRDYFSRRYAPNNMVLACCGNLDFDAVCELVEKKCSAWTPSPDARSPKERQKLP